MGDHTDDFDRHVEGREMDVLSDGILVGEIGACENIVNVDYHRRALVVLGCDEAAALDGDSHGLLKAGFHEIKHRLGHFLKIGGFWLALDPEGLRGIMDHRAGAQRDGNGLDAGDGTHGIVEVAQPGARCSGGGCGGGR